MKSKEIFLPQSNKTKDNSTQAEMKNQDQSMRIVIEIISEMRKF